MITILGLVLLVANIGFFVAYGLKWGKGGVSGARGGIVGLNIVLLLTNILGFQTLGLIGPGERGVLLRFNAVTDKTFSEGLYAKVPFVESVVKMSVQTLAYEVDAGAASRDLQEVATGVTLNYSLAPDKVNRIYQQLRKDYVERIIKPAVQESVKATTAQFDAEELISKRPAVRAAIEDTLKQRISPFGITVDALSITNFEFSPTFTAAIEAKVVAVQKALEAENRLRQIEIEARQREATAVGEANAILRVAEAQASANALVNKTLTADLIQFTLVQKLGGQIKVIMLPSNQPFILGADWLAAEGQ